MKAIIQGIPTDFDVSLAVLREDLLFPDLSGNKYRKLKYNISEARALGYETLLTFGGAFSNHIAAVAAAGKEFGFHTIGVIRGEELSVDNPTLAKASEDGMKLHFVSRNDYRLKSSSAFANTLRNRFGDFYLIPEGGTNPLAVKGCAEILGAHTVGFDYICCAVGTGGTIAGLLESAADFQEIIGFPAVKGDFLDDEIRRMTSRSNWRLQQDYSFGGYAKVSAELVAFQNDFYVKYGVPTDPVYTGKLFFGVMDLIKAGKFRNGSRILMVHTGGLQGIAGMNLRLKKMNLPLISYV